ncbi:MAG: hypothetical protein LBE10_05915 [Treponema sp.]|jgi:hypothetical protein|nr:hypothetical protein [Treponema sp.]
MDIADAFLEYNLGSGCEDWKNFYEFHKLVIAELEAFNYEEFKKNGFEVKKREKRILHPPNTVFLQNENANAGEVLSIK